jgi:5'-nucleotidase
MLTLIDREWIETVSSWPPNFEYREMGQVGKELSERLRDPAGDAKCDLIIALTHSRLPATFSSNAYAYQSRSF